MTAQTSPPDPRLAAFLRPLAVDGDRVDALSREFALTFTHLAAESTNQFLSTPISESILLPFTKKKRNQGRYLAIDIGGTNLRVGFIELLGDESESLPAPLTSQPNGWSQNGTSSTAKQQANANAGPWSTPSGTIQQNAAPCLRRLHERSWSIQDQLKSENAGSLFAWIGGCIASVVREGCNSFNLPRDVPLPMGVTFSFPMEQDSLSEAKLMSMGKGFTITSKLDLGSHLVKGYEKSRADRLDDVLPPITVAAIANDAVSTLVSFVYEVPARANQKAAMGIICGTGSNATLLMKRSKLHPSKRPKTVRTGALWKGTENGRSDNNNNNDDDDEVRIAVNTEWSINGTAPAMRAVGLISPWDDQLSQTVESPGFQPLEYMTAGRYLGELGRIMLVDYVTRVLGQDETVLPRKFLRRFEPHNTTFLSHYRPGMPQSLLAMLEAEFPTTDGGQVNNPPNGQLNGHANGRTHSNGGGGAAAHASPGFHWTDEIAEALYYIAKAIETRAAGIIAAAIVGLLDCADELPPSHGAVCSSQGPLELVVGYTGGCITNFQDYLVDCQKFLDDLVKRRYGGAPPIRIVLRPCHDGGIKGAGILVPASLASQGLLKA
ncbi:hexokinase family protein [Niveomyces insectorum RCEF 264]|uniref:Phosphotransferase n=1 Tax=Niveomyces insectorum RCEF 264 TaxID=1081102 RepID=A0A167MWT2_9HYPO|nr:hexokinase family protein [Niveomyces insectorum RCEF 264]